MLTNYVFLFPIKSKTTEEVIKAYLKNAYSTFGGSKYILSDKGGEFTGKQFTLLVEKLGFIKVYTSHTGNSVIEQMHSFLKASLPKLICNHNIDWDELTHVAVVAYNVSHTLQ